MISYFAVGGVTFFLGILVGNKIHTKKINEKILYLHILADRVKENNNKFVKNLGDVYTNMDDHDASKFTEVDEMLMEMWID